TALPTNLETASFVITTPTTVEVPGAVPTSTPEGFLFTKNMRSGDRNDEVAYLQICLKNQGFFEGNITGNFDVETKQSVMDFQEFYREDILAPWGFTKGTGLVQKTTMDKLNEVCFAPPAKEEKPAEEAVTQVPEFTPTEEMPMPFYLNIWFWVGTTALLGFVIILLLVVIIVLLARRQPSDYRKREQLKMLKKEEIALQKTRKELIIAKLKIEKQLKQIDKKLEGVSKDNKFSKSNE
ncbi:MAG: peptidoglycan-binding domain-containing protein, partial [Patescibacteria group bacterium]|nr:peptidoglycan-binding domain-containing protein [Patescibacteria group bacterium]